MDLGLGVDYNETYDRIILFSYLLQSTVLIAEPFLLPSCSYSYDLSEKRACGFVFGWCFY